MFMEPILIINRIADNELLYHVKITQGAEQITDEIELTDALKGTFPDKKGIVKAIKLTQSLWEVRTKE
jgi:hypothetical protein